MTIPSTEEEPVPLAGGARDVRDVHGNRERARWVLAGHVGLGGQLVISAGSQPRSAASRGRRVRVLASDEVATGGLRVVSSVRARLDGASPDVDLVRVVDVFQSNSQPGGGV